MVLVAQYFSLQPISEAVVMFTHYNNNNTTQQNKKTNCFQTLLQTELGHNFFNMNWMKKLSLFGSNWKLLIFKISTGINDHTHKDPKNQVDLFFQLFVYILQQNK